MPPVAPTTTTTLFCIVLYISLRFLINHNWCKVHNIGSYLIAQLYPARVSHLALLASSGFCGREAWLYESLKYPLLGELTTLVANRAVAKWFYRQALCRID